MPDSIFKFILKYSYKKQIYITLITLLSFPVLYFSLELPKLIINHGVNNHGEDSFHHPIAFLSIDLDRFDFLFALSFLFLISVLVSGLIKMYINTYKGRLGENMLRQLRFILFHKLLHFPASHFKQLPPAQIIPVITSETEPLGGFIGDAFSLPIFQGGTLLVYIAFIFIQDPILGISAISLYPIQAYLIPKLQKHINLLTKERVIKVRALSSDIADTTSAMNEIHLNASETLHLASFTTKITEIFKIRYEIYVKKFFMKFLNNFFNQLTPFFFYSIGGYAVIKGNVSIGALVAVLAAYKDLASPWKELLNFYQQKENVKIKYEQIRSNFVSKNLFDESVFKAAKTSPITHINYPLKFNSVALKDKNNQFLLKDIDLEIDLSKKTLITGNQKSHKEFIGKLIARSYLPSQGAMLIKNYGFNKLPFAFTSRKISYLSQDNMILNTSIYSNITHPVLAINESNLADSRHVYCEDNIDLYLDLYKAGEQIDYAAANVKNESELKHQIIALAKDINLDDDLYQFGLQQTLNKSDSLNFTQRLLMVRQTIGEAIQKPPYKNIIKRYHIDEFNEYASVIENLIFGTPCLKNCAFEQIYVHPYFIQTLKTTGLYEDLIHIGIKLAITIQDLFANLPDGHHFFDQFDFVTSDLICEYKYFIQIYEGLGKHKSHSIDNFNTSQKNRLIQFTFSLIPSQHRLELIDMDIQKKIIQTRKLFIKKTPESLKHSITFFNKHALNNNENILENILFGKIILTKKDAQEKIQLLIRDAIDTAILTEEIMILGLNYQCGPNGSNLTLEQCQKIHIIKALIKDSDVFIFNEEHTLFDSHLRKKIEQMILKKTSKKGLVWIAQKAPTKHFDTHIVMQNGIVESQIDLRDRSNAKLKDAKNSAEKCC